MEVLLSIILGFVGVKQVTTIFIYIGLFLLLRLGFKKYRKGELGKKNIIANLVVVAIFTIIAYFIIPRAFNEIIFQHMLLNIFSMLPVLFAFVAGWILFKNKKMQKSLKVVYTVLIFILSIGLAIYTHFGSEYQVAKEYSFEGARVIAKMIDSDPKNIRFTPPSIAATSVNRKFNTAAYEVERKNLQTIELAGGGAAYSVAVTPAGKLNPFFKKVKGAIFFDDTLEVDGDKRLKHCKQKSKYGEGTYWWKNIFFRLYRHDMWCIYDNVYNLRLNPDNPEELTKLAVKRKFEYRFPFFFVAVSGGVTLMDHNGNMTSLTDDQIRNDKRLKGRATVSIALNEEIVANQVYEAGILGAFYRREGKIEVPELSGDSQFPFRFPAADGRKYNITLTEPAGKLTGLSRVYYIDTQDTSKRYVYKVDSNEFLIGPQSAVEIAMTLPGYQWMTDDDDDDQLRSRYRAIWTAPIIKNGVLWHMVAITKADYTGMPVVVMVNSKTEECLSFDVSGSRDSLYQWLAGDKIPIQEEIKKTHKRLEALYKNYEQFE